MITPCFVQDSLIYIEQKYRALFHENYTNYFKDLAKDGDVILSSQIMVFHKKDGSLRQL